MRVIYVSNLCLPKVYDSLFEDKCYKSSEAAQKYNRIMAEGFVLNGCEVISLGVVPVNRNVNRRFISLPEGELNGVKYRHLKTINLPLIKQLLNAINVYFGVIKLCDKKNSFVICDGLSYLASKAAVLACKLKKIKSVGIITDLPEFLASSDRAVKRYKKLFDEF